jgi:hypothetical protein
VSYLKLVCILILTIIYSICFLKFVVPEMNSKMVKSGMGVLIGRVNDDANSL